jgi:hypothetical protein
MLFEPRALKAHPSKLHFCHTNGMGIDFAGTLLLNISDALRLACTSR